MPEPGQPRPKETAVGGPPPPAETGWLYILHGDDELGTSEELARLRQRLGKDSAMADLNTNVLAGAQLTMGELRHACDTVPFLSDRRLVIVRGLLARLAPARRSRDQEPAEQEDPAWKRAFVADLLAYLPQLPHTARLVFVESELLDASHKILRFARERGTEHRAYVKAYQVPKDGDLPGNVHKRVRDRKGTISTEAAKLLADLIGPDLRLLDLEIEKLLAYADGRQVTAQDVELLVSQAREAVIFELTDCMSRHETATALRLLHRLLEEQEEPPYLLSMLSRQIRILMQVGQLRSERLSRDDITRRLGLHPFVVEKALAQAGSFSMAQLEAAHSRLVETDWAIKTGEIEPPLALDLLVVALSQQLA
jgi:DNA polymerase-3 subunit delta